MNKKAYKYIIFAILTILVLGFNKVVAAQKLVCIYDSYTFIYKQPLSNYQNKENSPTIMIEQDSNGRRTIYTNNKAVINENWKIKTLDAHNTVSYDTNNFDQTTNALNGCPKYMTYQRKTFVENNGSGQSTNSHDEISINFNDNNGSSLVESYDSKSYQELLNEVRETSSGQQLSCAYEGSWFQEPVLITQDSDGTITVRRKQNHSDNGVYDWYDSRNELNFDGTEKKLENANGYVLTGCPQYVTFKFGSSNTIYLNDKTTIWNDNELVGNYDVSWSGIQELFSGNETSINPNIPNPDTFTCSVMLGTTDDQNSPAYYINKAFDVIKYVAILLLIVLSVVDFTGAIASQDNDILNKTVKKTITRAILCVVIFILPSLVKFALNSFNSYQNNVGLCGIGGITDVGGE